MIIFGDMRESLVGSRNRGWRPGWLSPDIS